MELVMALLSGLHGTRNAHNMIMGAYQEKDQRHWQRESQRPRQGCPQLSQLQGSFWHQGLLTGGHEPAENRVDDNKDFFDAA